MIALRSRALSDISGSDLAVFIIVNITYGLIFYRLTINALEKQ